MSSYQVSVEEILDKFTGEDIRKLAHPLGIGNGTYDYQLYQGFIPPGSFFLCKNNTYNVYVGRMTVSGRTYDLYVSQNNLNIVTTEVGQVGNPCQLDQIKDILLPIDLESFRPPPEPEVLPKKTGFVELWESRTETGDLTISFRSDSVQAGLELLKGKEDLEKEKKKGEEKKKAEETEKKKEEESQLQEVCRCHKHILMASSAFFRGALHPKTEAYREGHLVLDSRNFRSSELLLLVIEYFYTQSLEIDSLESQKLIMLLELVIYLSYDPLIERIRNRLVVVLETDLEIFYGAEKVRIDFAESLVECRKNLVKLPTQVEQAKDELARLHERNLSLVGDKKKAGTKKENEQSSKLTDLQAKLKKVRNVENDLLGKQKKEGSLREEQLGGLGGLLEIYFDAWNFLDEPDYEQLERLFGQEKFRRHADLVKLLVSVAPERAISRLLWIKK